MPQSIKHREMQFIQMKIIDIGKDAQLFINYFYIFILISCY